MRRPRGGPIVSAESARRFGEAVQIRAVLLKNNFPAYARDWKPQNPLTVNCRHGTSVRLMADRPSLEVEIPPTRSILYLSSSKELLHTALAGAISGSLLKADCQTKPASRRAFSLGDGTESGKLACLPQTPNSVCSAFFFFDAGAFLKVSSRLAALVGRSIPFPSINSFTVRSWRRENFCLFALCS